MLKQGLIQQLKSIEEFFERSTSCLAEEDSAFAAKEGLFTVAGQVAHVADTVDWCIDGMFNPKGFDMDFETHMKNVLACTSLNEARAWFKKAIKNIEDRMKEQKERLGEVIKLKSTLTSLSKAISKQSACGTLHIVRSGDSLERIAKKYNTSVKDLKQVNGLSSHKILIDQELKIPE